MKYDDDGDGDDGDDDADDDDNHALFDDHDGFFGL